MAEAGYRILLMAASTYRPTTNPSPPLSPAYDWRRVNKYRLSDEKVPFLHEIAYLPGVRMLADEQIQVLHQELATLMDPRQIPKTSSMSSHSNESTDPDQCYFMRSGPRE